MHYTEIEDIRDNIYDTTVMKANAAARRNSKKRSQMGAAMNEQAKAAALAKEQYLKTREKEREYRTTPSSGASTKTKLKDLAKSYQDTYNVGMDMVVNFFKRK